MGHRAVPRCRSRTPVRVVLTLSLAATLLPAVAASAGQPRSVLTIVGVAPSPFYPRVTDGWRDELNVAYRVKRCAGCDVVVRQRVLNSHGTVVLSRDRRIPKGVTGPYAFRWNGRRGSGVLAAVGRYRVQLCVVTRGTCDSRVGTLATGTQARTVKGGSVLTTAGTDLLLNGRPFVPVGFSLIGALAPPGCWGTAHRAAGHLDETLGIARSWGANTVRLQVSQEGLTNVTDWKAYLDQVRDAVARARTQGFAVIVSLQDQWRGCGPGHPLPSAQSETSWRRLAPAFRSDHAVMFELFNEPQSCETRACWAQWRNGGPRPNRNQGDAAVGHQRLVNVIRGLASNVIVVDGRHWSFTLAGLAPPLSGANIVYAWHPFFYKTPWTWDDHAGFVQRALHRPLLASEWNPSSNTGHNYPWCKTKSQAMAIRLVDWLSHRHVGIVFQGLDEPRETSLVWDWGKITACDTPHPASGYFVRRWMGARSIAY